MTDPAEPGNSLPDETGLGESDGAKDAYTELYYHFVWVRKRRDPYITDYVEKLLLSPISRKCAEMDVVVYAMNCMPDHLHLAGSVPPTICVSDFVRDIKGASAYYINHLSQDRNISLAWQPGYGALTFSKSHLPVISAYIENQKEHHANKTLKRRLERVSQSLPGEPLTS